MMFLQKIDKKILTLAVAAIVIFAGSILFVIYGNQLGGSQNAQQRVAVIAERGIDVSHSLYTPDETTRLKAEADERLRVFAAGENATSGYLENTARKVSSLRDFRSALELFSILDSLNPADLFYKVEVGNIYLELQQWENARLAFEPLKVTWPVHEAYLGLATAYKNIDGTPNYVIDQIYEESMYRHQHKFEVLDEYAKWLEATDREKLTIPLYEEMYTKAPQEIIKKKIETLKAKYK